MRNFKWLGISSRIKNIFVDKILSIQSRKMSANYTENYTGLQNSAFSNLYPTLLNHNIEIVDFDKSENYIYLKKDNLYFITTPDYPWIIREVFCHHIYFINPKFLKYEEYTVFDIGMNRGYATLYFANQPWCKKVYGFELNEHTFEIAARNVELNLSLKEKISIFNYGLGNKDENLKSYYLPHRDGICTTSLEFLKGYAPAELERVVEMECYIKKASTTLKEIIEKNSIKNIIVKIDVEGAEYDIINDLIKEYPDFFNKVSLIIGEAHLGLDPLTKALNPFNFKEFSEKKFNSQTQDFLFSKI